MTDKIFFDTNLWIYLYSENSDKKNKVKNIIINNFDNIILSSQVLNEMYNVLTKKINKNHQEVKEILIETITNFNVTEINVIHILNALNIKEKYKFSYWDCLILSSALESDCSIVYSEDMQNNQIIDNKIKIINPFL